MTNQTKTELVNILELLIKKYGEEAVSLVNEYCAATAAAKELVVSKKQAKQTAKEAKIAKDRGFDFSLYRQRRVAIQLQYDGGPYFGFASQVGECEETIEKHLFEALLKVRLISNRADADYSRCGRTDAGVSAFGQVIGLNVRSAFPVDESMIVRSDATTSVTASTDMEGNSGSGLLLPQHPCDSLQVMKLCKDKKRGDQLKVMEMQELDYCHMLNRVLPPTIRAIAWKPVTPKFNARFSAGARTYRYFFVNRTYRNGSVQFDIDKMNQAVQLMIGVHDFRNFCKMDITSVSNFTRNIYSAEIKLFSTGCATSCEGLEIDRTDENRATVAGTGSVNTNTNVDISKSGGVDHVSQENVYMLEISGMAFLWHMVRCIMSVLFLVGAGLEDPGVVTELLNIEKFPGKPNYPFAPEKPLVLHKCGFDRLRFNNHSPKVLWNLNQHYNGLYEYHLLAAARCKNAMQQVQALHVRSCDIDAFLISMLDGGRDTLEAGGKGKYSHKGKGVGASADSNAHVRIADNNSGEHSDESASKRSRLDLGNTTGASIGSDADATAHSVDANSMDETTTAATDSYPESVPLYTLIARLKEDFGVVPDCNCLPGVSSNSAKYTPLTQVSMVDSC